MNIEPEAYAEIVGRLVSLRPLAAELAEAYDDPVAKQGAAEMLTSVERVLKLLEHRE